jgi:hypothetical protein
MTRVHLHGDVRDSLTMPAGALHRRAALAGARAPVLAGSRRWMADARDGDRRRSGLDGRPASAKDATE